MTATVFLVMNLTVLINADIQLSGQGIYNGRTHTVQTSRYLVSATAEFSSGMEDGKDSFHGRTACFLLNINGNSPTVIDYSDGIVFFDKDLNVTGKTSQRLIN